MWKLCSALGIILLGGIGLKMAIQGARINSASYERIQKGMSFEEVQEILGVPPGIYTSLSTYNYMPRLPSCGLISKWSVKDHLNTERINPVPDLKCWYGDEAFISVYFDCANLVSDKFFYKAYQETKSPFEGLWRKVCK
jgi:hypothetical protein